MTFGSKIRNNICIKDIDRIGYDAFKRISELGYDYSRDYADYTECHSLSFDVYVSTEKIESEDERQTDYQQSRKLPEEQARQIKRMYALLRGRGSPAEGPQKKKSSL